MIFDVHMKLTNLTELAGYLAIYKHVLKQIGIIYRSEGKLIEIDLMGNPMEFSLADPKPRQIDGSVKFNKFCVDGKEKTVPKKLLDECIFYVLNEYPPMTDIVFVGENWRGGSQTGADVATLTKKYSELTDNTNPEIKNLEIKYPVDATLLGETVGERK